MRGPRADTQSSDRRAHSVGGIRSSQDGDTSLERPPVQNTRAGRLLESELKERRAADTERCSLMRVAITSDHRLLWAGWTSVSMSVTGGHMHLVTRAHIGVAVVVLLAACGSTQSGVTVESVTSASVVSFPGESLVWTRLSAAEESLHELGHQRMFDVAVGYGVLVAVGEDTFVEGYEGETDAAAWWSSDGLAWERVPHNESTFGGADSQRMVSVAALPNGFVAVGIHEDAGQGDAAVWFSLDGRSWERVAHDEGVLGGAGVQRMDAVAAFPDGVVAVGLQNVDGDADGAVWLSPDGLRWSRVTHVESVFGGTGNQEILAVTPLDGGLVAVGVDTADGDLDGAVWWSSDGVTWQRIQDDGVLDGPGDQIMLSVCAVPDGVVAVGVETGSTESDELRAAVWWSEDGRAWERIGDATLDAESTAAYSVECSGFGVWMAGVAFGAETLVLWSSPDGRVWDRLPDRPAFEATFDFGPQRQVWPRALASVPATALSTEGLVMVGLEASIRWGDEPAIWMATAIDP